MEPQPIHLSVSPLYLRAHPAPSTVLSYCHLPTHITRTSLPSLARLARLWNEAHEPSLDITIVPSSVWKAKPWKLTPLAKISRVVMTPEKCWTASDWKNLSQFHWVNGYYKFQNHFSGHFSKAGKSSLIFTFGTKSAKKTKAVFIENFHTLQLLKMPMFTHSLWLERKKCG